ncbi:two-component regulator propeller domain-containing protein, partial [uncultured Muribaculum sp.]
MLRIIIISIILLFGIVSHAQRLRTYDYAELTCGRINAMAQDSDGFIWIATENGLNRFDGWKMKYYLSDQNDS